MTKLVPFLVCLVVSIISPIAFGQCDDCNKTNLPSNYHSLVKSIESITSLCQFPEIEKIPADSRKEFIDLFSKREKFYSAMSEIGNDPDESKTTIEKRGLLLKLAKDKAEAEIKAYVAANNLKDVLDINAQVHLRVIKFSTLLKKMDSFGKSNVADVANSPFPADPDWAKFSLQNKLSDHAIVELYLEDKNGRLHLFKKYNAQGIVGTPGPKLKEGDFQVPEGDFLLENPSIQSRRLVSLGVDANPNQHPDRGSNIKIHGSGTSEGCIVLSNASAMELAGYVSAGRKSKKKSRILITPFAMESENYLNYADQLTKANQKKWAQELSSHPDLKKYSSLKNFWKELEQLNEKFRTCRFFEQTNCVPLQNRSILEESSCLRHQGFRIKRFISDSYQAIASKSKREFDSSKVVTLDPPKSKDVQESPKSKEELKCPDGTVGRFRIDYMVLGAYASSGTYVIQATDLESATKMANKAHTNAYKLIVKPFCMKLSPAEMYLK